MSSLEDIRKNLDRIDREIIKALAERQEVIKTVSSLKNSESLSIRDLGREEKLLSRIRAIADEFGLDRYYAEELFREIITNSVRFQTHSLLDHQNKDKQGAQVKVSYQGTDGAYSHLAAVRHFQDRYAQVDCYGYDTFQEAAKALKEGYVDYAMLPIENTTAGSINDTYDILGFHDLHIVGEEILRIVHCLLTIEKVELSNIKRVFSHPKAIEQCTHFLSTLPRTRVESYVDTAISARRVLEDNDLSQAAIAGAHTADLYGLHVLEHDIANQKENFTRFVVVADEAVNVDEQIPSKISLMMITSNEEGSLIDCLNVLHQHGINMSKLESRPRPNEPWRYTFYLDVEGNVSNPDTQLALEELSDKADSLRILGCYPKQQHEVGGI